MAEEPRLLHRVDPVAQLRRHVRLHLAEHLVQRSRAVERAAEDQVRKVRLVLERVGLRQYAAVGMPEQVDLPEVQVLPDRLDVLDHVLDGVALRIFELLGPARAALVDEDEAVGPRERQQVRQEVVVRGARPAVEDQQWLSVAERLVVDEDAVGVDEARLDLQDAVFGSAASGVGADCRGAHEPADRVATSSAAETDLISRAPV